MLEQLTDLVSLSIRLTIIFGCDSCLYKVVTLPDILEAYFSNWILIVLFEPGLI